MKVIEELSSIIAQFRYEDFPSNVTEEGKKCLLDWIGVAIGGAEEPIIKILLNFIKEIGEKEQASIIGYGKRVDIFNAALINSVMSHVLDFDDANNLTRSHLSSPLLPALLAISEYLKLKGKDLITAFVLGYEVSVRIGLALGKRYYEKGWHATPILGRFGAAIGVAKLLGLPTHQITSAIGLAGIQASGMRGVFGTMGKSFQVGKAAADGIFSALLAQRGFQVSENVLKGEFGFFKMFAKKPHLNELTKKWGKEYYILRNSFKPYPVCLLIHPVIDGIIQLKKENHFEVELIKRIFLKVSTLCFTIANKQEPKSGLEGRFSIYFCAALSILEGEVKNDQFNEGKLKDNRVKEIMKKIWVEGEDSFKETEAVIIIQLKNGREFRRHVTTPKGDYKNPMSFEEIIEKCRDLTKEVLLEAQFNRLIKIIQHIDELDDISILIELCCSKKLNLNHI